MKDKFGQPPRVRSKRTIGASVVVAAMGLQGCSSDRTANLVRYGSDVNLQQVVEVRKEQDGLLASLGQLAGIDVCLPESPDAGTGVRNSATCTPLSGLDQGQWYSVAEAGLWAIDRECQLYLDAIFWFDRAKDRTVDQIGLTAVASTAITGFTGGSSQTLSILASAFGLVGASVENVGSGLLYDIGPSSVHEIVVKSQTAFRQRFDRNQSEVSTRIDALNEIQNYAEICLPPKIETDIRAAVKAASFQATGAGGTTVEVKVPPEPVLSTKPEDIEVRKLLNAYLLGGSAAVKRYFQLAKENGLSTDGIPQLPITAAALVADEKNAAANRKIAIALELIEKEES